MTCKTQKGQDRKLTSGDGRKNFDTDIKREADRDEAGIREEINFD